MPDADYFDRLLARHAPVEPRPSAVVRARPRLPGPFERPEAWWSEPPEDDAAPAPPLMPAAYARPQAVGETAAREREIRTERETVVRTGPPGDPEAPPPARPAAPPTPPPPRPTAPLGPGLRPVSFEPPHTLGRGDRESAAAAAPSATSAPRLLPAASTAPPSAATPRPGAADAAAARTAARTAARRGAREPERTVHVQIGRLEVNAGGSAKPSTRDRQERAGGRRPPTVNLRDYLARDRDGEKGN